MANTFKAFLDDDIVSTRTLLHENIPITGSIVSSSTYTGVSTNIKSYSHGMFQTVYDYPYTASAANQLFDMNVGNAVNSPGSGTLSVDAYAKKKINIYNQMAQMLVGYDVSGNIMQFDRDGDASTAGDKFTSMYYLDFSRLLVKDEIKKGSFNMILGVASSSATPFTTTISISDASGTTNYKINSPVGEYGILYAKDDVGSPLEATQTNKQVGFVFYQAGIVALSAHALGASSSNSPSVNLESSQFGQLTQVINLSDNMSLPYSVEKMFETASIDQVNAGLRKRIKNIQFNNTTELNSTIHFCRVNHNDFNYSSNPTYLSASQIRVKNLTTDAPVSYFTTVGLYSPDNELLAVAKLSEPLKKDPTQELILRVRLDY